MSNYSHNRGKAARDEALHAEPPSESDSLPERVVRWFVPPSMAESPDQLATALHLIRGSLSIAAVGAAACGGHLLALGVLPRGAPGIIAGSVLILSVAFLLKFTRNANLAGATLVLALTAAIVTGTVLSGGLYSQLWPWTVAIGVVGAILVPDALAPWSVGVMFAVAIGVFLLDSHAGAPPQSMMVDLDAYRWKALVSILALGTALSCVVRAPTRTLRNALRMAHATQMELQKSRERLSSITSSLPIGLLSVEPDGHVSEAHGPLIDDLDLRRRDGRLDQSIEQLQDSIAAARVGAAQIVRMHHCGRELDIHVLPGPRDAVLPGRAPTVYALLRDVTQQAEEARQRRLTERVFAQSPHGITLLDSEGRVLDANAAYTQLTGYTLEELIGREAPTLPAFGSPDSLWERVVDAGRAESEESTCRRDGSDFILWTSLSVIYDDLGIPSNFVALASDVTERRQSHQQLRELAERDPLTGLANRRYFLHQLDRLIDRARASGGRVALLFLDLDGFKAVNDTLGHDAGDALLVEVASRLRDCVRERDILGRFAGDEFTVALCGRVDSEAIDRTCQRILEALDRPFEFHAQRAQVGVSIGVALFPDHGEHTASVVKSADTAMYVSKQTGRNRYTLYDLEMSAAVRERFRLEAEMREGIRADEFVVYYQPKLDIHTDHPIGMEALVRWERANGEIITPGRFWPLAEQVGLSAALGRSVLVQACLTARRWYDEALIPGPVSVNLSLQQLRSPQLVSDIADTLETTGLPAGMLELELTEDALLEGGPAVSASIAGLRAMGVRLSVDDFGTGLSSLVRLQQMPIDELKIDGAFTRDLASSEQCRSIVGAVVSMARALDLNVHAESVEATADLAILRDLGCDSYQGFVRCAPLPEDDFERWLHAERGASGLGLAHHSAGSTAS